jgi:thiamine monophosphate kinase
MGNTNRFSVGKAEGKRPLGRPRYKLEDQIKINQNVGYSVVGYILLAQNRGELQVFLKRVRKLQVP